MSDRRHYHATLGPVVDRTEVRAIVDEVGPDPRLLMMQMKARQFLDAYARRYVANPAYPVYLGAPRDADGRLWVWFPDDPLGVRH